MKTMQMRTFLRGGYKEITEMTLVTNHGHPAGTWMPQKTSKKRTYTDVSMSHAAGGDSSGVLGASDGKEADKG